MKKLILLFSTLLFLSGCMMDSTSKKMYTEELELLPMVTFFEDTVQVYEMLEALEQEYEEKIEVDSIIIDTTLTEVIEIDTNKKLSNKEVKQQKENEYLKRQVAMDRQLEKLQQQQMFMDSLLMKKDTLR